jgi:hypothetical protein
MGVDSGGWGAIGEMGGRAVVWAFGWGAMPVGGGGDVAWGSCQCVCGWLRRE